MQLRQAGDLFDAVLLALQIERVQTLLAAKRFQAGLPAGLRRHGFSQVKRMQLAGRQQVQETEIRQVAYAYRQRMQVSETGQVLDAGRPFQAVGGEMPHIVHVL